MITQASIKAAYLRACYGELVRGYDPVVWFGAGSFASRLAGALAAQQRGCVRAIADDRASVLSPEIRGIPVLAPSTIEPPCRVVLATDAHAMVFTVRINEQWGDALAVVDLFDPPEGSWVHPCDAPGGFVRTHRARWRESVGLAQLELESIGGAIAPADRWRRAHELMSDPYRRDCFGAEEHGRFIDESRSLRVGQVVTIRGDSPLRSDAFWAPITSEHFTAFSPDGCSAAMIWARRDELAVCPLRTGNALWIPSDKHEGGRYTVRFDRDEQAEITVTRERTYADLSGASELSRYERMIPALPVGARVLDCASGTGFGAMFLQEQGFVVTGAEIDQAVVAFAKARYPGLDIVCASAQRLPFSDNTFDAVVCIETLEHVDNPDAAISEFARVCKPDGLIALTTPDVGSNNSPYHRSEFSSDDLHRHLDRVLGSGRWISEPVTRGAGWHEVIIRTAACARL